MPQLWNWEGLCWDFVLTLSTFKYLECLFLCLSEYKSLRMPIWIKSLWMPIRILPKDSYHKPSSRLTSKVSFLWEARAQTTLQCPPIMRQHSRAMKRSWALGPGSSSDSLQGLAKCLTYKKNLTFAPRNGNQRVMTAKDLNDSTQNTK